MNYPTDNQRFHIALSVADITQSIADYSHRLGEKPCIIVKNEYALWRTATLNFSIRKTETGAGTLRHLGFETSTATAFTQETDCNGLVWEQFTQAQQEDEIRSLWPRVCP